MKARPASLKTKHICSITKMLKWLLWDTIALNCNLPWMKPQNSFLDNTGTEGCHFSHLAYLCQSPWQHWQYRSVHCVASLLDTEENILQALLTDSPAQSVTQKQNFKYYMKTFCSVTFHCIK
jgi:hypothetical protein